MTRIFFRYFLPLQPNTLHYNVAEQFANATLRVFTLDGRMTETFTIVGKTGTIDVQQLFSGTYIIMVSNGEEMFYQRFQVIR
jgi:hypothetical protein